MTQETLGKLIRSERNKRDWSQAKLAEKVGVATIGVIRWEQDKNRPHPDTLLQLIEVLELDKKTVLRLAKAPLVNKESGQISPFHQQNSRQLLDSLMRSEPLQDSSANMVEVVIPPMKIYRGWRTVEVERWKGINLRHEEIHVTVNGQPLWFYDTSDPFFGNVNPKKKKMYEWGYTTAGPRQLALSILADYFGERGPHYWSNTWSKCQTRKYYQNFKMDFVAWFPKERWELHSEAIAAWLREQKEMGDPAPEPTLLDVKSGWRGWSERWDKYANPT